LYRRTRRGIWQDQILGTAIRTVSNHYDANGQERSRPVQFHEPRKSRVVVKMASSARTAQHLVSGTCADQTLVLFSALSLRARALERAVMAAEAFANIAT
jgi:hypothetical protein